MQKRLFIYSLIFLLALTFSNLNAKSKVVIKHLEPMNWWVGMKNPNLQILVHGDKISDYKVTINYPGVELKSSVSVENPNYLFLNLIIDKSAKPGIFPIQFSTSKKVVYEHNYELLPREKGACKRKGFDSSDAMYLLMPDRFANGNPDNDNVDGMIEQYDRNAPYGRHGGDIKGILNNLDYIQDLGLTAIWLNPVLENNQPEASYHGYAITDYYKVDARFGSNEDYKALTEECKKRDIKMVMDMVFNHCGSYHWWMKDLPMSNWIHKWDGEFTRTNYRLSTVSDPYVSKSDLDLTTKGWFDTTMPDLNLKNEFMLTYLTQNSIWWIEYVGLGGIRMDTYPYPDKHGMRKWVKSVMTEYPDFNIVGETWMTEPSKLAYWQNGAKNTDGFDSLVPSLFDFPIQNAIRQALNEDEGWSTGMLRLYNMLADDYLYPNPLSMVVFPDNHDDGRIFEHLNKDFAKFKMALTYMITTRGALQMYYGTELLMDGDGWKGHANIRQDFPGGWEGDSINSFVKEGRTADQNEAFNHIQTLLQFRKKSDAIKYGKTLHFIPENGVYVYFRYSGTDTVMVIMNNGKEDQDLKTGRFNEILSEYSKGLDILSNNMLTDLSTLTIKSKTAKVIELSK